MRTRGMRRKGDERTRMRGKECGGAEEKKIMTVRTATNI
jgi:hypothetical protein